MDELGFWLKLALWIIALILWRAYVELTTIRAQTDRASR
jgi:hypothetical protein